MKNIANMRWKSIGLEAVVLLLSLVILIPFYMVIINSLKGPAEASVLGFGLPAKFVWRNYLEVFEKGKILLAFKNSCIITIASTLLIVLTTSSTAFVLQRRNDVLSGILNHLVLAGLIVPASIVPIYWVMHLLHLTGKFSGVILVYIATVSPLTIFLYYEYIKSISRELDEAAIIDGCSQFNLFYKVIFPIISPVTVTVLVISFIIIWNDFVFVIYFLSSSTKITLPLTIYFFSSQYVSRWDYIFADIVIASIPTIGLYFSAQKQIISGMTAGAIKG